MRIPSATRGTELMVRLGSCLSHDVLCLASAAHQCVGNQRPRVTAKGCGLHDDRLQAFAMGYQFFSQCMPEYLHLQIIHTSAIAFIAPAMIRRSAHQLPKPSVRFADIGYQKVLANFGMGKNTWLIKRTASARISATIRALSILEAIVPDRSRSGDGGRCRVARS